MTKRARVACAVGNSRSVARTWAVYAPLRQDLRRAAQVDSESAEIKRELEKVRRHSEASLSVQGCDVAHRMCAPPISVDICLQAFFAHKDGID